ncbi:hypothetical protein GALMADRAFT_213535 [Galerina marginata CBS 339.88]|uniref:Uncharacterized protein n=1 Tax=Galerina marginata (strain CBS 339.88) TaxID=685588 RepID=A0A067SMG4_GALM3|nr:hypothetical protein GALMADRAFT_213535 [Galerina marginata CBS 339.88]
MNRATWRDSRTLAECQEEVEQAQAAYDAVKRKRNLPNGKTPDFKVSAKSRRDAAKLALKNAEKPRNNQGLGDQNCAEPTAVMKTVMGAISSFRDFSNSTLEVKKEIVASSIPEGVVSQITINVDLDERLLTISLSAGNKDTSLQSNTNPDLMDVQIGANTQDIPVSGSVAFQAAADEIQVNSLPYRTGIFSKDTSLAPVPLAIAHLHDMDCDKPEAETMQVDRPADDQISLSIEDSPPIDMTSLSVDDNRTPSVYSNREISLDAQSLNTSSFETQNKPTDHAQMDNMSVDGQDESSIGVDIQSVSGPEANDFDSERLGVRTPTPVDNTNDEMITRLMSAAPDPFFRMPATVDEFLNYKFTFLPVDWDDIATPLALRTLDETDKDYKMRRDFHTREYEYNDGMRQQSNLNRVYKALEQLFNDGKIPPKNGRQLLSTLDADRNTLSSTILDLQKRYNHTKTKYDRYKTRRHGEAAANSLKKKISELKKALFTVDSSKLIETRKELDAAQASLQGIIDADAAAAVAAGGKAGKAKGTRKKKAVAQNDDNDDNDETGDRDLKYLKTDDNGREKLRAEGNRAVQAYLNATTEQARQRALNDSLRVGLRRTAREVQEFLPESSYASKEVAVQIHLASSKNFVCRYHSYYRADGHAECDRADRLTGVGYPKRLCSPTNGVFPPKPGHMHCGCGIDEVLLEYFFWKNLTAFSSNPRLSSISRSMGDREFIPPRLRSFWVNHFKSTTGITINDLYSRDAREAGWIAHLTAKSLLFQMNALNASGFRLALAFRSAEEEEQFNQVVRG